MAGGETRHRTVVEIGVDDRQVRGLGQTMERAFDPAIIEGFERSLERLDRTLQRLAESMEKATSGGGGGAGGGGGPRAPRGGGGGGGGPRDTQGRFTGGGGGGGGGSPFLGTMGGAFAGTLGAGLALGGMQRMAGAAGTMAQGRGFVGQMASAVPFIGPALGGAVSGIGGFYQQYAQQQSALAGSYGRTGLGRGQAPLGAGIQYGLDPTAMAGALGNYAQQTGMQGAGLAGIAPQLLEAEKVRGFGGLGAVLGGAGASGGRTGNAQQILEDSISTGFQLGIRESRMDQFFTQMGGWIETMRNQGINISPESATALATVMSNLGLKGMSGLRAAQNVQQAMGRLGKGGGSGSVIGLRAAGMSGGGFGNLSFMQARAAAERNPAMVMQNIATMLRDSGITDPEALGMQIEAIMGSMGVELGGPGAVMEAANRVIGGGNLMDTEAGQAAASAQKARRQRGAEGTFGAAAHEAAMSARRGATGAKMAQTQREIDRLEISLAEKTLPAFSKAVGGAVSGLEKLVDVFSEKGMSGLMGSVQQMSVNAGEVIINQLGESFSEAVFGGGEGDQPGGPGSRPMGAADFEHKDQSLLARTVRSFQKGGPGAALDVLKGGEEPAGAAEERQAYYLRKAAEAAEDAAREKRPNDDELANIN